MVYKSLNGLTPSYLCSKFIQWSDMITSYNLRTILKISLQFPCHVLIYYYKKSFSYRGAILWNSLPSAVSQATSLTNFRRLLIKFRHGIHEKQVLI